MEECLIDLLCRYLHVSTEKRICTFGEEGSEDDKAQKNSAREGMDEEDPEEIDVHRQLMQIDFETDQEG